MSTTVSAPGKVLLAGGYLVLDRQFTGLVFGLSARIHVVIQNIDTSAGVELQQIVVQSPQFKEAKWIYGYHQAVNDGGIAITQLQGTPANTSSRNPFVETALAYALTYITSKNNAPIKPVSITILADNDYYSQPSQPPSSTTTSSPRFTDFGVRLTDAHKTGLGSSAALVTAFTGALLSHYLPFSPTNQFSITSTSGKAILHNLAQAAHCAAQGKVGSGFDVAAAVHGTCIYRRFSPSILSPVDTPNGAGFVAKLKACVEDDAHKWDTEIVKDQIKIPAGMALVMCDVDCGSSTPGMVKKVQAWRAKDPESGLLWERLQGWNEKLAEKLKSGSEAGIASAIHGIRDFIREMGGRSDVPIEPKEQTELLDALTELEGVVGGVVPGAGGYDAVVVLVKDDEETINGIREFLLKWSKEKGSNVKLLGVKGEMEGVKVEGGEKYAEWLK